MAAAALAIGSLALVVATAALMLYAFVTRKRRWRDSRDTWWTSGPGDDEPGAGVREPRRPLPSGSSAAALADPDDRAA